LKKKYDHKTLSEKKCRMCDKRLKLRLVEQKQQHNIFLCYQHYSELRKRNELNKVIK
jgi:hypothetical protein